MKTFLQIFILFCCLSTLSLGSDEKMIETTKRALLAYPKIEKGTNELTDYVKRKTIGDNEDLLLYFIPLATGRLQYEARAGDFFYDYRQQTMGVNYRYRF
jgi:hypothetical protein